MPWRYHSSEEWHVALFDTLTDEQKVAVLLDYSDESRIDMHGGYPSVWTLLDGKVIIATISDGDHPELIIKPVADYIAEELSYFEDYYGHEEGPLANACREEKP